MHGSGATLSRSTPENSEKSMSWTAGTVIAQERLVQRINRQRRRLDGNDVMR
jgi:hypothetical protein